MQLNYKKVYFSGIGGIGVSALAKMFLQSGVEVVGSDSNKSEITEEIEKLGIKVNYKQTAGNITGNFDLMIYSPAVSENNPERQKAKKIELIQKSYPEMLGKISKMFETVAVSGTNGKSTTTAMLAQILLDAGIDPTVILGSKMPRIDGNFHQGKSKYFVVEACEYRSHMMNLSPKAIILTNIEEDHLDYFKDLHHIISSFQQYIEKLGVDDLLVINNDDLNIAQLNLPDCKIMTYGINKVSDVMASNVHIKDGHQIFELAFKGENVGEVKLQVPGVFNVYNALAAICYAMSLNVSLEKIKNSLHSFPGSWRRFEKICNDDITVISDYAHHPTAVAGTIQAARDFYSGRRIIAVFQPHQHSRTKELFNEFVESLINADVIILSEIFDVAGREETKDQDVSSDDLAKELNEKGKEVYFTENLKKTIKQIQKVMQAGDVILVMGAGSVYTIVEKIIP